MTGSVLEQYGQIIPTIDLVFEKLDHAMKTAMAVADRMPIPAGALAPFVTRWNQAVTDLGRTRSEIAKVGPELEQVCHRALTLRQAGELWQELATDRAYPLAKSLDRTELDDGVTYAWGCGAVNQYWQYVGDNQETAESLAGFSDQLGLSLVSLADAIEKQNTELGWAVARVFLSLALMVAGVLGLMPLLANVGAKVAGQYGAIIAAIIGGLLSLVACAGMAWDALHRWQTTTKIVANQGVTELATLEAKVRALEADAWPAPRALGSASDFQEG